MWPSRSTRAIFKGDEINEVDVVCWVDEVEEDDEGDDVAEIKNVVKFGLR